MTARPPFGAEPAELARALVVRAQQGDRTAQAEVLRRYARVLHRLVVTTCPSHEAEELVQSLLLRLLEVLPRFEPSGPAKLTTWVFTVAHRFLIDQKKRARPTLVSEDKAASLEANVDLPGGVWRAEVRTALERALSTLPDEQRRPLVLVHVFDHPLDEVAAVEGVPVGTIKSRLFRARVAMAAVLGPQFAAEMRHG